MAGVITTGSFPKLLWPGLNEVWSAAYNEYPPLWQALFDTYQSEKKYEEDVGMTAMGLAPVKDEGDSLAYDTMKQNYIQRYTHLAYALGYAITKEEIDDNQYAELGTLRAMAIGKSMRQTKENVGADIFNRAFNASYPGGDGRSLVNESHPTEGGTQSNTLETAADLSEASLEQALIDIKQFRDERNNHIEVRALKVAIPSDLEWELIRILKNPQRPDTANRDINAMYQRGVFPQGYTCNIYFTDSDAWFILTDADAGLKHFQRVAPVFENDNDFDTKNALFSGYERYSFGWTNWRAVYGSPGV
jgi:hypothetical protein